MINSSGDDNESGEKITHSKEIVIPGSQEPGKAPENGRQRNGRGIAESAVVIGLGTLTGAIVGGGVAGGIAGISAGVGYLQDEAETWKQSSPEKQMRHSFQARVFEQTRSTLEKKGISREDLPQVIATYNESVREVRTQDENAGWAREEEREYNLEAQIIKGVEKGAGGGAAILAALMTYLVMDDRKHTKKLRHSQEPTSKGQAL